MPRTLRAAVIGTGHIARQHLACLKETPGVEIAAVCDLSPAMAESAAERYRLGAWYTDHRKMLDEIRPEVVHVTTPVTSHFALAYDALSAGAHVIVEKPATVRLSELEVLQETARSKGRFLIEDYNYVFNKPIQKILDCVANGEFGQVVHVDVFMALDIAGKGSPFADADLPHPSLRMEGGAISDFLPHFASLLHFLLGKHESVRTIWSKGQAHSPLPSDEFRALVQAKRGTASVEFSANARPEGFWIKVHGTKMRAATNLFEAGMTLERIGTGPKALHSMLNSLEEARQIRKGAYGSLWRKLSGGPGSYEGLWSLLRSVYRALSEERQPPVSADHVRDINALAADFRKPEYAI